MSQPVKSVTFSSDKPYLLTQKQIFLLTAVGVIFWFVGAMCVKFGSAFGFFGPTASIFSFGAGILISWLSVRFMVKLVGLSAPQIVPGVSFGLAVATFFDGIFITWGPTLYGSSYDEITLGAAWILWGACTFLTTAFVEAWRRDI